MRTLISGLAVGAGSVWVADPFDGSVWRIRPRSAGRQAPHPPGAVGERRRVRCRRRVGDERDRRRGLPHRPANERRPRRRADRVSTRRRRRRRRARGSSPRARRRATPRSRPPSAARCSPAARTHPDSCSSRTSRSRASRVPSRRRSWTACVTSSQQRGFEAGGYTVGFQSCDASTAQAGGSDFFRCGSNAKAYARNLRVVGVVGSFGSPCSYVQIPVTNEAAEGPLAMVEPVEHAPGADRGRGALPVGRANYVRIAGADHLQAVAHAQLAKSLGARRVAVLSARATSYISAGSPGTSEPPDGSSAWTSCPSGTTPRPVTSRRSRGRSPGARPDVVVVADLLGPESAAVIRAVRAAVGPKVAILAPDGFAACTTTSSRWSGPPRRGCT